MGIESLFALIAFLTLSFLWIVLPNAELATEPVGSNRGSRFS